MRNRAKCYLCQSIIESFHSTDTVECACGEIAVMEGEAMKCAAKNFGNFLRVDDEGNEIIVKVQGTVTIAPDCADYTPCKADLQSELKRMIDSIEAMPPIAMNSYVTQYDLWCGLRLISAIMQFDEKK